MSETKRVFIGGIGYTYLRDLSVGPTLIAELKRQQWPTGVEIDDLSPGGPIATVHRFRDVPLFYERVLLLGSMVRGRQPGRLYCYRWDGQLPDADEIQMRVAEGITGVISVENTLIVGGFFGIWPSEVVIIEVEPRDTEWGTEFSEPVQFALAQLPAIVQTLALTPLDGLPTNAQTAWEFV